MFESGPGEYNCPDCGQQLEFGDEPSDKGLPRTLECRNCGYKEEPVRARFRELMSDPQADAEKNCPDCGAEMSLETVGYEGDVEKYRCPICGHEEFP